jgi:hypothetical protein
MLVTHIVLSAPKLEDWVQDKEIEDKVFAHEEESTEYKDTITEYNVECTQHNV